MAATWRRRHGSTLTNCTVSGNSTAGLNNGAGTNPIVMTATACRSRTARHGTHAGTTYGINTYAGWRDPGRSRRHDRSTVADWTHSVGNVAAPTMSAAKRHRRVLTAARGPASTVGRQLLPIDGGRLRRYRDAGPTGTLSGNPADQRRRPVRRRRRHADQLHRQRQHRRHAGGGLYIGGTATLTNTIVAGNSTDISGTVSRLVQPDRHRRLGRSERRRPTATSSAWPTPDWPRWATTAGRPQTMAASARQPGHRRRTPAVGVTTDQRGFAARQRRRHRRLPDANAGPLVVNTTGRRRRSRHRHGSSLREAVACQRRCPAPTTITFDPTVFATPQTITLTGGQLELSNTTGTETITGPAAGVTVSGGGASRVFQVDAGVTASISGLTITGGNADNGGGLDNSTARSR